MKYEVKKLELHRTFNLGCYQDSDAETLSELLEAAAKVVRSLETDDRFTEIIVFLNTHKEVEMTAKTTSVAAYTKLLQADSMGEEHTAWYPRSIDVKVTPNKEKA